MKIASSSIGMESARTYTSVSMTGFKTTGSVFAFPGILDEAYQAKEKPEVSKNSKGDDASVKPDAKNERNDFKDIFSKMRAAAGGEALEDRMRRQAMERIRVECIQFLLYMLFGVRSDPEEIKNGGQGNVGVSKVTESYMYYRSETEETVFNTTGNVLTKDGRSIDFNLELTMSRSFTQYYEQNYTSLKTFTDPLVINLDVPTANVSDVKISFDLDADKTDEEINVLDHSSGYLALDSNGDGLINDGSELFGTSSGDGFLDLARFDTDNNGWIDEADEIFDRLVIAFINEDGSQELVKLKDRDIGALYTGSAQTDFSLNDSHTNETNARIRRTGIFLYESGAVGTLQHLDLAQ